MAEENFFNRIRKNIPESFWRFVIIGFIIYSFIIVGKVIYDNYLQNKTITKQKQEIRSLKDEIVGLELNIAYFKTATYKEKVARAKLRYALPGENVIAVSYDQTETPSVKSDTSPAVLIRPNYTYWQMYFFGQ